MRVARNHRTGLLLAGATAVVSGLAVFVNGYGVRAWSDVADAATYTTLKNGVAAVILIAIATGLALRQSPGRPRRPSGPLQWIGCATVAVVGGSIPFLLFFEGLARADSAQAAFIHKTLIIWVAILAVILLGERLKPVHVGAIALLVLGQAVLIGGTGDIEIGTGEAMILAATLLWAVEVVVARRLLHDVGASTLAVSRMAGGSAILVAFVVVRGVSIDMAALTWEHAAWILTTGMVLSAYVGSWYLALARAPAVDVTSVLVGGALITALLRTGIQGAPLPAPAGLALLGAGVVLIVLGGISRVRTT